MQKIVIAVALMMSVAQAGTKKTSSPTPAPTPTPGIPDRIMKYYEIGKKNGPVLYYHNVQYQKLPDGSLNSKSTVTDPNGKLIFTENIISKGSTPSFHSCDVYQTKRHLEMEVKDGTVYLRTKGIGDNKEALKEDTEKLPENFITGPLSETFAVEHMKELMDGETVKAKMAILELREFVTFKFSKKEMTKMNGHDVMVVTMKPSSIFISLLVDTIYLYIDTVDKKLVHFVGRTPLWKWINNDYKPLDAEIAFE